MLCTDQSRCAASFRDGRRGTLSPREREGVRGKETSDLNRDQADSPAPENLWRAAEYAPWRLWRLYQEAPLAAVVSLSGFRICAGSSVGGWQAVPLHR